MSVCVFVFVLFVVKLTDQSLTDEPQTRADFLKCEFFFISQPNTVFLFSDNAPKILKPAERTQTDNRDMP